MNKAFLPGAPIAPVLTALLIAAVPAHASELTCRANYDFCVEVDGKYPPDATFFTANERGKFLVDMPSSGSGVLIDLPARKAVALPDEVIVRNLEPGVAKVKNPIPAGAPSYALSIEGPVLRFQTDRSKVRVLKVLDRPPVVGPITLDALLADRAEYREAARLYNPDRIALDAIRQSKKPLEIEAFFATWCQHCKVYMPKFLRVMKDAANPNIKLTLIGVPKGFGNEKGPWEGKGIQSIPAIILRYQGRDLTRLGTHETAVPESELAGIVSALR
jgi:thiol-disulfide isomerase/thioredoxin